MTFSWPKNLAFTLEHKKIRERQLAKSNPDHKIKYPDEARDAAVGNYTKLDIRIKKRVLLAQKQYQDRVEKTNVRRT